jgi:hypothetical protein
MRLGYLLPTREQIMDGRPQTKSLLDLAERAPSASTRSGSAIRCWLAPGTSR